MFRMTKHARIRMHQRNIQPWHVLAALEGKYVKHGSKRHLYTHSASRTGVVVDPRDNLIITVMRLAPKTIKRRTYVRKVLK